MPRYKNTGKISRILMTVDGDYVRCAPGQVTDDIQIKSDNPVMRAYLARGGGISEIKPKKRDTK